MRIVIAHAKGSEATQSLYLNGTQVAVRTTAAVSLTALGPATNLTFGGGYIGGSWPSQPHHGAARPDFYSGQLADVTVTG